MLKVVFLLSSLTFFLTFIFTVSVPQSADIRITQSVPVLSASQPQVVGRGDQSKRCPPGFQELGKECVKVDQVQPQAQCPPNSEFTSEGSCAVYVGKSASCPNGFNRLGSRCERREVASPQTFCATGYTLTNMNECTAPLSAPPMEQCVGGSVRRGDMCILDQDVEPELTCPPGYTLDGKKCRIEELYNCTPERPVLPPTAPPTAPPTLPPTLPPTSPQTAPPPTLPPFIPPTLPPFNPGKGMPVYKGKAVSNQQALQSSAVPENYRAQALMGMSFVPRGPSGTYQQTGAQWRRGAGIRPPVSKDFVPELIDYVVQATCKRIRTIAAQKLCARGVLNGKMCKVEVEVPPTTVSQESFEVDVQPPQLRCPEGFSLLSQTNCVLSEVRNMIYVCPEGTQDIGDRCAAYSPPSVICPPGFALVDNGKSCVQTLHAPPIVEYSVRYACVGKDCAQ